MGYLQVWKLFKRCVRHRKVGKRGKAGKYAGSAMAVLQKSRFMFALLSFLRKTRHMRRRARKVSHRKSKKPKMDSGKAKKPKMDSGKAKKPKVDSGKVKQKQWRRVKASSGHTLERTLHLSKMALHNEVGVYGFKGGVWL